MPLDVDLLLNKTLATLRSPASDTDEFDLVKPAGVTNAVMLDLGLERCGERDVLLYSVVAGIMLCCADTAEVERSGW